MTTAELFTTYPNVKNCRQLCRDDLLRLQRISPGRHRDAVAMVDGRGSCFVTNGSQIKPDVRAKALTECDHPEFLTYIKGKMGAV